tara:strand:+ start:1077 stop:1433 length:357 start_codon:yes stop_codon:yes gene_type:complete
MNKDWSEHKVKNKIKTAGYFIKRLKDNGFVVFKMFNAYSSADPRRWTVLVDPGYHSVYITCFTNKNENGEVLFEFDDGGNNFNKGFYLKTNSIEVVINSLLEKGINNDPTKNPFSRIK